MSEHEEKGKWWMWLVMPVAAVLGATIASFIVGALLVLAQELTRWLLSDTYTMFIDRIIVSAAFGVTFVEIANWCSPSHKITASVVMVSIWGTLMFVSTILQVFVFKDFPNFTEGASFVIGNVVTIVASSMHLREIKNGNSFI